MWALTKENSNEFWECPLRLQFSSFKTKRMKVPYVGCVSQAGPAPGSHVLRICGLLTPGVFLCVSQHLEAHYRFCCVPTDGVICDDATYSQVKLQCFPRAVAVWE
jgi:hypothetical protein